MKTPKTPKEYKCDVCDKYNAEVVEFKTKVLWFIPKNVLVCQTCISKAFRSFRKDK